MPDFDEGQVYERDYHDNFSIRELATSEIMPKYFPDSTTHLTVGLEGMIGEYIGDVTEDSFNTASTLLMETFPTRAQFSSSIYSDASIFQLSNVFAKPADCDFIIILKEDDIRKNFVQTQNGKYRYFYIDKDTKFFVEEIPFTLDYDIRIKAKYVGEVNGSKKYIYSASYILTDYKNSVTNLKDPYIKVRTSKNGLIALHVTLHQYIRTEQYEDIVDNSTVNYSKVDVPYDGELAGIDVLYKAPCDDDFNTQLQLKPIFSQPSTEPFCYYKKIEDGRITLSFTPKDGYFQPKFNSELKIIIYTTMGEEGNFDAYTGDNIVITKNTERYQYEYSWTLVAKPKAYSDHGKNAISTDELKNLTVEGFSTATALTTENDLKTHFGNFATLYGGGSDILFLKKRDDAVERLFSAFLYVKKDDYFYPTNTLSVYTNILKLDYNPIGFYHMSPGYLFGYKTEIVYYLPIKYHSVFDYNDYYVSDNQGHILYYENNSLTLPKISITQEELDDMIATGDLIPGKLQWYKVSGENYDLYDEDGIVTGDEASTITEDDVLELFLNEKVTFGRKLTDSEQIEFLTNIEEEANYRKAHLRYIESWKKNNSIDKDITLSEYVFNYPYSSYESDMGIDPRISIFDEGSEDSVKDIEFAFTNPFLMQLTKDTGLVGYYLTYISQKSSLDFCSQNDDDAFVQFIAYNMEVTRNIGYDKKYTISVTLLPSVTMNSMDEILTENLIFDPKSTVTNEDKDIVNQFITPRVGYIDQPKDLQTYNKELLSKNNLRVVLSFFDKDTKDMIGYMEMIPTNYDGPNDQYTFEAELETDDFITSDNKFRAVHRCPYCGNVIVNSANKNVDGNNYYCPNCSNLFKEGIINILENDDILLPITDAEIEITVLYRNPDEGPSFPTDNIFAKYDNTFNGYRWTNIYGTLSEPITFIEPLNMVRGTIEYQDYYKTGIEALDAILYDMPVLKWSIINYKDEGMEVTNPLLSDDVGKFYYFMDRFKKVYDFLNDAKLDLRNCTNIDVKFYNTYGRSNNFVIGEDNTYIDTNNIAIYFDVWVIANTDLIVARDELKDYIKSYIESINSDGTNDLYISNLIRSIEENFAYVHHLKFKNINTYDTTYQSIKNVAISLDDLSKDERRHFVPELLVVNKNNINILIQEVD